MPQSAESPHTMLSLLPERSPNAFTPKRAMLWYDSIIDDMFANPGGKIKEIAARLGRSPVTISYVVNSDLFRARLAQRRERFNAELDYKITHKLTEVASLSLDLVKEKLETSRTAVPLPILHDIATKSLDKLGYGVKPSNPTVQVNLQNNNTSVTLPQSVSPEVLEEARASLRLVENAKLVGPAGGGEVDGVLLPPAESGSALEDL